VSEKFEGKVAVVTGASKGLGAAIAVHLAAEGAAVVVNYAAGKEGADRVVAEITAKGGKAVAVQADVANQTDIRRLFGAAKQAFGRLDVLVNNAGVYEFTTQEAIKHLGPEGGSIINICSVVAAAAPPTTSVHIVAEAAADAEARSPAKELAPRRSAPTPICSRF
jgi:3-oxoacyl-[acyl-carrier protein] reductase